MDGPDVILGVERVSNDVDELIGTLAASFKSGLLGTAKNIIMS